MSSRFSLELPGNFEKDSNGSFGSDLMDALDDLGSQDFSSVLDHDTKQFVTAEVVGSSSVCDDKPTMLGSFFMPNPAYSLVVQDEASILDQDEVPLVGANAHRMVVPHVPWNQRSSDERKEHAKVLRGINKKNKGRDQMTLRKQVASLKDELSHAILDRNFAIELASSTAGSARSFLGSVCPHLNLYQVSPPVAALSPPAYTRIERHLARISSYRATPRPHKLVLRDPSPA